MSSRARGVMAVLTSGLAIACIAAPPIQDWSFPFVGSASGNYHCTYYYYILLAKCVYLIFLHFVYNKHVEIYEFVGRRPL